MEYKEFLERKAQLGEAQGFEPIWIPEFLFDFQRALVEWAIRKGRAAIFADCGLGKTPMQLVWAENVVRKTNKPALILTPLAVSQQTVREAGKFSIDCRRSAGTIEPGAHIVVTNYEKLSHFNRADFGGVVCDESSAIKSFDGVRRAEVTEFMRHVPYRLLCTATAAPNDYVELGTSAEALGEMGHMDMLQRFFVNDQNSSKPVRRWTAQKTGWASLSAGGGRGNWRFKGHAEDAFWKWVCSWARACRRPSDLGFEDKAFILPPLTEQDHTVKARTLAPGTLFDLPATNFWEEREERRRTITERCEMAASLVKGTDRPAVIWCHLNPEGDLLEKIIPDGRQVSGQDSDESKEEAFESFVNGSLRVLIIKPKIGAFGLNWEHCSHVISFASHSYEQYYQAVRRCWRFRQTRPVIVDLISAEGEANIKENLRRKAEAADRMFTALVGHMNDSMRLDRGVNYTTKVRTPKWL
jgi:hypothetical protein